MPAAAEVLSHMLQSVRGAPIEYSLAPYRRVLARVRSIDVSSLTDVEIASRAAAMKARVLAGEPRDRLLPEFFALGAEACARAVGLRPFDVQLMAGVALHQGKLAQMATGEGKTLVAVLPAALHALDGRGVHVLTANDYLARRDAGWMGPVYRALGFVGRIGGAGRLARCPPMRLRGRRHVRHGEGGRLRLPPRPASPWTPPTSSSGRSTTRSSTRRTSSSWTRRACRSSSPAQADAPPVDHARRWPAWRGRSTPGADLRDRRVPAQRHAHRRGASVGRAAPRVRLAASIPRQHLRPGRDPRRAPRRGPAPARPRLHRARRPRGAGRRVHGPRGREPPLAARHPARGRGQGGRGACGRKAGSSGPSRSSTSCASGPRSPA